MEEGYYNNYNYTSSSELQVYKETEKLVQDTRQPSEQISIFNNIIKTGDIQNYNMIIVNYRSRDVNTIYQKKYIMTKEFKNAVDSLNAKLSKRAIIVSCIGHAKNIDLITDIFLAKSQQMEGGKKAVVKHTVKQLQAIASKNNIKITKKVDGKTVRLNKQGLIAKLKRYKLI